jgi:hypothetical protein
MAHIKYVCLSDLHLGEEDSLLTHLEQNNDSFKVNHLKPSPVLEALAECLQELFKDYPEDKKPTLILAGDVLELALCGMHEAAMGFERFIEATMVNRQLFGEIIFLPGNHDHHLWELARETQYVRYLQRRHPNPGDLLPKPWHITDLFLENQTTPVESFFLTNLIRRFETLKKTNIRVFYPNLAVRSPDRRRCTVFTHGHYTEPLYYLMSTLNELLFHKKPRELSIEEIEEENFAWIDFFWSAMGRSGKAGKNVERIYEMLQTEKGRKKLAKTLAENLAARYDLPGWGDWMEAKGLEWALNKIARKAAGTERGDARHVLGPDAEKELEKFVEGPLLRQIKAENNKAVPKEVTLIYGHTHKPFQDDKIFDGYTGWVNIYNTGGWVVETVEPEPRHGGSIVVVDEELNAASVRMYTEKQTKGQYAVSVAEASHGSEAGNPLYKQLREKVNPRKTPWKDFSATVADEVKMRAKFMRQRIRG